MPTVHTNLKVWVSIAILLQEDIQFQTMIHAIVAGTFKEKIV